MITYGKRKPFLFGKMTNITACSFIRNINVYNTSQQLKFENEGWPNLVCHKSMLERELVAAVRAEDLC